MLWIASMQLQSFTIMARLITIPSLTLLLSFLSFSMASNVPRETAVAAPESCSSKSQLYPALSLSYPCSTIATDYIKNSCKLTNYPNLCIKILSVYAKTINKSDHHLAFKALSINLSRARSAANYVTKLARVRGIKRGEYMAVKDCIENMYDSVDRLRNSLKEFARVGHDDEFMWHMSNVQTWVSAALTDETTCVDAFDGRYMDGSIKVAIRHRIIDVAKVTSISLALVNLFASRHRE